MRPKPYFYTPPQSCIQYREYTDLEFFHIAPSTLPLLKKNQQKCQNLGARFSKVPKLFGTKLWCNAGFLDFSRSIIQQKSRKHNFIKSKEE